jgi:hypothetical protein
MAGALSGLDAASVPDWLQYRQPQGFQPETIELYFERPWQPRQHFLQPAQAGIGL